MKRLPILTTIVVTLSLALTGCVSSKKIVYFQGSDTLFAQAQEIAQQYEMRIKPADEISIRLSCSNDELLRPFAQMRTMGAGAGTQTTRGMGNTNALLVDKNGRIRLPQLGYINVLNMTTREVENLIEQKIRDSKLAPDPVARVEILTAHVTVIGATSGIITLHSARTTIIEIISSMGDLPSISKRHNIRLFREENGKRKMYKIDITKADIFSHPAYYVQQNDIIYIEENKSINIKSSPVTTFLSAGSSILGTLVSCISFAFLIKNHVK